jgi:hypothetical protein
MIASAGQVICLDTIPKKTASISSLSKEKLGDGKNKMDKQNKVG